MGKKAAEVIRDRVVELRRVRAADLLPNPANWRRHPKPQADALAGVLRDVGYADALLARETPEGLMLLDGHLRASLTPDTVVPVLVTDLNDAEAAEVLATLDPLAAMAEADATALDALLRNVQSGDAAVQAMLAELAATNITAYGEPGNETDNRGSAWDRIHDSGKCKVVIGQIESHIPVDLAERLEAFLTQVYNSDGTPIPETLAAILEQGMAAIASGSDRGQS